MKTINHKTTHNLTQSRILNLLLSAALLLIVACNQKNLLTERVVTEPTENCVAMVERYFDDSLFLSSSFYSPVPEVQRQTKCNIEGATFKVSSRSVWYVDRKNQNLVQVADICQGLEGERMQFATQPAACYSTKIEYLDFLQEAIPMADMSTIVEGHMFYCTSLRGILSIHQNSSAQFLLVDEKLQLRKLEQTTTETFETTDRHWKLQLNAGSIAQLTINGETEPLVCYYSK